VRQSVSPAADGSPPTTPGVFFPDTGPGFRDGRDDGSRRGARTGYDRDRTVHAGDYGSLASHYALYESDRCHEQLPVSSKADDGGGSQRRDGGDPCPDNSNINTNEQKRSFIRSYSNTASSIKRGLSSAGRQRQSRPSASPRSDGRGPAPERDAPRNRSRSAPRDGTERRGGGPTSPPGRYAVAPRPPRTARPPLSPASPSARRRRRPQEQRSPSRPPTSPPAEPRAASPGRYPPRTARPGAAPDRREGPLPLLPSLLSPARAGASPAGAGRSPGRLARRDEGPSCWSPASTAPPAAAEAMGDAAAPLLPGAARGESNSVLAVRDVFRMLLLSVGKPPAGRV
jgi:hypothetical protein